MSDSFPRQAARTRQFSLGTPRNATVTGDGRRVLFVRSRGGTDAVGCLWQLDPGTGEEALVADPRVLLGDEGELLSPAERARRERARESGAGIVGFALDSLGTTAVFALSGRLFLADLNGAGAEAGGGGGAAAVRELPVRTPALDPRLDPTGSRVAYVCDGTLRIVGTDPDSTGGADRALSVPDGDGVAWGLAEFVAAEEMERFRGYWWAPDGRSLLAARVDDSPVRRWHIADPEHPEKAPAVVAYPAAGTANAEVALWHLGLDGSRTEVAWDRATFPYLARVSWTEGGDGGYPVLQVVDRRQRRALVLRVDPATGATRVVREESDSDWIELVPGAPAVLPDGRLVHTVDADDTRRLCVDGTAVTPPGLQVLAVIDVSDDGVLVSATDEPTEDHVWHVALDGALTQVSSGPGLHAAAGGGPPGGRVLVLSSSTMDAYGRRVVVRSSAGEHVIASHAEAPTLLPSVTLLRAGARGLRTALLLPTGYDPDDGPLPVLLDPYAGPKARYVVAARNRWLTAQWFADQGFAVLATDGRGTPARGPAWERAIAGAALADAVLTDQVDALHAVAAREPALDLTRVAIRGWSFGGFLAALAVLRRPDVFSAAVAGAPVTDWSLYDTYYTERYLGLPDEAPEAYASTNLIADAARLERPLLLIHGLADDNVVAAHSLRLSSALLAAGRPHTFLPLSGVTHMTPQEVVAENLLLLQVRFLQDALARPTA